MSDGARECLKGVAVAFGRKPTRTDGTDQSAEHRVGARKMLEDVLAHLGRSLRGCYF